MGFDRPDEDDAPTTARRDSPAAGRDPVPVDGDLDDDSDEARAAYNIEYRALVDAEYAAAPDSWTAAVPALRRTWEEHEKKYPHPERSRLTVDQDGSWHGEGGLELNPCRMPRPAVSARRSGSKPGTTSCPRCGESNRQTVTGT